MYICTRDYTLDMNGNSIVIASLAITRELAARANSSGRLTLSRLKNLQQLRINNREKAVDIRRENHYRVYIR